MHRPSWFSDGYVFVSYAPTAGINKDGGALFLVDPASGGRTDEIDDTLRDDVAAVLKNRETTATSTWVSEELVASGRNAVPVFFDRRSDGEFEELLKQNDFHGFSSVTLGELIDRGDVIARQGHGSPSADLRSGKIPYIKVSDLRAGQVNINPTNRVPEVVARKFWRDSDSGLQQWDLLTPTRTSKNIGDFSVLMPGQERVVLTKEILVLRASDTAVFDNFFLLWALSLRAVRRQWDRIIFMQTNREDVGTRYRQIRLPIPPTTREGAVISDSFRSYYLGIEQLRSRFLNTLGSDGRYNVYLSSEEAVESEIIDERLDRAR